MSKTELFGRRLDNVEYNSVLKIIGNKANIYSLNLHVLRLLDEKPYFAEIHKRASVVCADGMWVVYLVRLLNGIWVKRINGTELVERILKRKKRCFLIGPHVEVSENIIKKYSNVVGSFCPSFQKEWSESETNLMLRKIEKSGAEVVLVGVSNPKAEKWIDDNCDKLSGRSWLAVGSSLEILAGKRKRVPRFLAKIGLEWVWRVILEPRRLAGRYISDGWWLIKKLWRRCWNFVVNLR